MQIFYVPHIDGQKITLSEEESKHCVRVLRLELEILYALLTVKAIFSTAKSLKTILSAVRFA